MFLRDWWLRVRALVAPRRADRDLDDELSFHLAMETRRNAAAGMTPEEAGRRARLRFGPVAAIADACRDAPGITLIETVARDVVIGIGMCRRAPTVTATVIATIAFALGVNTALFTRQTSRI